MSARSPQAGPGLGQPVSGGFAARREAVLERVSSDADALLVTSPTNIRYLTGFTGSNAQLLLAPSPVLLTDGRYAQQSAAQVPDLERVVYRQGAGFQASLREAADAIGVGTLAFESSHVTVAMLETIEQALDVTLVGLPDAVERARARKDPGEVDCVRRAQAIAETALCSALGSWSGGTELELALEIEWAIRTGGADGIAFEVIVAAGPHAALPHARPRRLPVAPEDVLLIDLGARIDGYCSDMTRTYLQGAPDPLPKAHGAVVRAVEAAVEHVRPGTPAAEIDRAARDVLAAEGFGEAFVHSTGHGVGLDVHEAPRLASDVQTSLEPGMILTIEPGVYLPGVGGVRVEELVLVTESGAENLTRLGRGPDLPGPLGS